MGLLLLLINYSFVPLTSSIFKSLSSPTLGYTPISILYMAIEVRMSVVSFVTCKTKTEKRKIRLSMEDPDTKVHRLNKCIWGIKDWEDFYFVFW